MEQTPFQQVFRSNLFTGAGHLRPDQITDGGKTAKVLVVSRFVLTLDDRRTVLFTPGLTEIPESLAEHWGVKAHTRPYKSAAEAVEAVEAAEAVEAVEAVEPEEVPTDEDETVDAVAVEDAAKAERDAHTAKLAAEAVRAAHRSAKGRK